VRVATGEVGGPERAEASSLTPTPPWCGLSQPRDTCVEDEWQAWGRRLAGERLTDWFGGSASSGNSQTDVRCRPSGSLPPTRRRSWPPETVERAQPAHPPTAPRRGRCRRRPQAGGAHRSQAAASQPDPRAEVAVGHGGNRDQLRRGGANLLLRHRAAATWIAARLTCLTAPEHGQDGNAIAARLRPASSSPAMPPTCPGQRFTAVSTATAARHRLATVAADPAHGDLLVRPIPW
jgi:hypothetical protein